MRVCVCTRACVCVCGCSDVWRCACACVRVALLIQHATLIRHIASSFVVSLACVCVRACVCARVCGFTSAGVYLRVWAYLSSMTCAGAILSAFYLALPYFSILSHKWHDFREKKVLNIKCVFWFSPQHLSQTFLILQKTERDIIINVKVFM